MAVWTQLGKAAWELLKKYWPLALEAWKQVDKFVKDHPGLSDGIRQRIEQVREKFAEAQSKRTPEARVRATLDVIRGLADERAGGEGSQESGAADAAELLGRVETVERALRLAVAQTGDARRTMLRQVVKRTDALAAEVFMRLIPDEELKDQDVAIDGVVDEHSDDPRDVETPND